jgi:hypothetical protein
VNFNYSGSPKQFILITGLTGASGLVKDDAPAGWTYSLTGGTLSLDAEPVPDPPTAMLISGALALLGSLRRRMRRP